MDRDEEYESLTTEVFEAKALSKSRKPCDICGEMPRGRRYRKFPICGGCRRVVYCGQRCQREGWPAHKGVCSKFKKTANDGATEDLTDDATDALVML